MTKRWNTITVASLSIAGMLLLIVAGPVSLLIFQDALFQETRTHRYSTLEHREGFSLAPPIPTTIANLLPPSASDIYEKHNIDYNTVIVRFNFGQSDFPTAFPPMQPVPNDHARMVSPQWIALRSGWIPKDIKNGRADRLVSQGYEMYCVKNLVDEQRWYFLIHREHQHAYLWNRNTQ